MTELGGRGGPMHLLQKLLDELARRPEVDRILADREYKLPDPIQGSAEVDVASVEWGIDRIGAPLVWSTFGVRGEGVVVANIDTGVRFDHAALVRQYRGNLGGGQFDHNYNWFDPSNVCGTPSLQPCDNNGQGTHTIGTMGGDDGGTNQIGVAPNVKWIAAKGCESSTCSTSALLAAGQWVLAPTDLAGANPRPDLRPDIVTSSWSSSDASDTFFQQTVQTWLAAGIFPAAANGDAGPGCGTVGSPASYAESYGSGAFDINNGIASFSGRGPAPAAVGGQIKPDISAPGVNIRSAWNDGAYNSLSGTAMASAHVAGTVALMWSAAPSLRGDIASTKSILDDTAIDTSDLTCGGTAANNNVWGEGRLDAFAAVDQSPRGSQGTLAGTVTDAGTGNPIEGVTIEVTGPADRTRQTDASGHYSLLLPAGSYVVTASTAGHLS
jgi:subtilisin family serine protease